MNEDDKINYIIEFMTNHKCHNGFILNDNYNYYDDIKLELGLSNLYNRDKSLIIYKQLYSLYSRFL